MATYPLDRLAATIDANGISAPSYNDILLSQVASAKRIYGQDAYLEPDSQDGQLLGIVSKAISDMNDALIAAYNSRGPLTAVGEGLSSVVQINNITRLLATHSQVSLLLTGAVGTVIHNGEVRDSNGSTWLLPEPTTIGVGGTVTVTGTAKDVGDIRAEPNTVTVIGTPTAGWNSVNNAAAATPGQPVETDSALRVRQQVSPTLNSKSVLGAMLATLRNTSGVTAARIYENNTNATDGNGIPAKSLAVVVSGGASNDVADAIMDKRGPGVGLFGTTTVNRTDDVGQVQAIKFTVPTLVTIKVAIEVHALNGYTTTVGDKIIAALVAYFNGLDIGGEEGGKVYWSRTFRVANLPLTDPDANTYEINFLKLSRDAGTPLQDDVAIAFNERPRGVTANITLTAV